MSCEQSPLEPETLDACLLVLNESGAKARLVWRKGKHVVFSFFFLTPLLDQPALLVFPIFLLCPSVSAVVAPKIHFNNTSWDDSTWTLRTSDLQPGKFQSRMSLANGYMGLAVAASGPFFEIDTAFDGNDREGWPLFDRRQTHASIAGFYASVKHTGATNYPWLNQYGGESFISGVPHWSGLLVEADGAVLNASVDPGHVLGFESGVDFQRGVMGWSYRWVPGGEEGVGAPIGVEYSMFVHKLHVNQAVVRLRLTAEEDRNVTVYDVLDGTSAVRTDFVGKGFERDGETIWSVVSLFGLRGVVAFVYSTLVGGAGVDVSSRREITEGVFGSANASSIGQAVQVRLRAGQTAEISKFVGAASSDAFTDPKSTARKASVSGAASGYSTLLESHVEEWKSILPKHSVDSYRLPDGTLPANKHIHELQITSVTNPFHLLQNTIGPNAIRAAGNNTRLNVNSVSVCGLASSCYGGLIFWDAETWIALGLVTSHPQHIETVVNYRVEKYPQAKENVKMAYSSSKDQSGRFTGGAAYPWTSGRTGNCTGTGPCFDYEYHLNGDIALALRNHYIVTGDEARFKTDFLPIINDIAHFLSEVLDYNTTSGFYEIWNATDPDEYANNVNNVGFTTALILELLTETNTLNTLFHLPENATWKNLASQMRLPINKDVGIVLEYASMTGLSKVKQADVVLIDDLTNYKTNYSLTNLDYYANKQSWDGPGMTYATFSIVANNISPSGCSSYTYDLYSQHPYARLPWFQYSEQMDDVYATNGGTHPAFPFLTGMGGSNRIAIFGYLGLRLFADRLDIDPSLPPQITHLNHRTFYWQGHAINATSNTTHTTLRRLPALALATANPAYKTAHIPVTLGTRNATYTLSPDPSTPLIVPNRLLGQTTTVKGNILQCRPVLPTAYDYLPGQFPVAAIDGASSTKWQPYGADRMHYLTVDLSTNSSSSGKTIIYHPIAEIKLDWATTPPAYFEVLFTNHTLPPFNHNNSRSLYNPETDTYAPNPDIRNVSAGWVQISEPWVPGLDEAIRPVKGNQTNVTVGRDVDGGRVWSGRYAHLGVWGNLWDMGSGDGPTVAEWSVIAWDDDGEGEGEETGGFWADQMVLGGLE
ncbi:acid trehalase [Byssothecium circinans]|uniref:alpha,alpha-trehalase n=1 Tax=Byssothecium circinans TaxID=147558 RepID=A0A6A5U5G4_9PLEO|nr:acid trehalase [Byssothecium circinans]